MFRSVLSLALLACPAYAVAQQQTDPTVAQLSRIHLDRGQIYSVRDLTIGRDVLSITFNRGAIVFTEAIEGRVTGAVFVGSGDILAIPPDAIEKKQLFRYTKSPLLSEHFETAILRFTDGTWEEVVKELKNHASEPVDAADGATLLRWEAELERRAGFLNARILADLLGPKTRPFFLAQIEGSQLGWFDAIYDERNVEEVLLEQSTTVSTSPLVWTSFNKRAEARDPAAVAHEDKSMFQGFSVSSEGLVTLKMKADGERVLDLPVNSAGVTGVTFEDNQIPFFSEHDRLVVILPAPIRSGSELSLRIESGTPMSVVGNAGDGNVVRPANYRDQWIIEALANYAPALADAAALDQAREQLLAASPEGGSYESLGPVWIGFRMTQPRTTPGYVNALKNKSTWILHMLRNVIQREEGDQAFGSFLDEIVKESQTNPISTFDVKRLAEKHAGKSLDSFFESWVFATGIPSYSLTYKIDPASTGFVVSGNITQSGVPATFESSVPVYADEAFLGNVVVSSDGGEFRFNTRTKPQQIVIDPKRTLLRQQ